MEQQYFIKKARWAFKTTDKKGKELLSSIFGDETFAASRFDRIKSYEDACEDIGIDPVDSLPFSNPVNNRQQAANAFHMLDVITEALLDGEVLDWTNENQKKWFPWFSNYKSGSGFRFGDSGYAWSYANTAGGARLCVDTKEKADYLGSDLFLPIWNKFLNPNK